MLLRNCCMVAGKAGSKANSQKGHVYEASGALFVRYKATEIVDGRPNRAQRSHRLCAKDGKYYARDCKAAKLKRDEFMLTIGQHQHSPHRQQQNIPVPEFSGTTFPALLRRDMKRLIEEQLPELE